MELCFRLKGIALCQGRLEETFDELARRIRNIPGKVDLSQEIIDAIKEKLGFDLDKDRIAKGLAIDRANFGSSMQPFVLDLALYVGQNPGSSDFFMNNFLGQFR